MSRAKNATRNVIFGILNKSVSILGPFIMRTIILYKMGAEYVGLSGMFTSLLQVLNFAELGFSNAIIYCMYKPVANNDYESLSSLTNFFKKIYKIISLVIFVLGLVLMPFIGIFIKGDIPININIYILYFIYLVNLVSGYFLFAYKSSILLAYQRNDIDSTIQMIFNILMYVGQTIVILCFKNYYLYVILLPICTIIVNLVRCYKVNKMFPNIKCKGTPNDDTKKEIKKKVLSLFGHKIGLPITNSIDSLVVSSYLGLTVLAIYDNYSYIFQAIGTILTICYTSITPSIGNSVVTEKVDKNYETFLNLTFLNLWCVSWCSIAMMILYQNFMYLWVGKNYLLPFSTIIMFSLAFFVAYMRFITTTYKDACGMWYEDRFKPYIICICNLVFDIIVVKYFNLGIFGVITVTLLLRLFVAIPIETYVLFKNYFKKSMKELIKLNCIWIIAYLFAAVLTYFLTLTLCGTNNNIISLFVRMICVIIIPNIIFFTLAIKTNYMVKIKTIINKILIKEN